MARKFVISSLTLVLSGVFCMIGTYDAMPQIACGFAIISTIISVISYAVDKFYKVGIWEI